MSDLVELVWIAPLAAVAVTSMFALCVMGATRSSDMRREGRVVAASAYLGLSIASGMVSAAGVAAGLAIIITG